MKKIILCLLIFIPFSAAPSDRQIQNLVYEKNWAGLEQNLKSGAIIFPESEQAVSDYLLGYALLKQGKSREAVEPLTRAGAAEFPLNAYAHYYLGKVLMDLDQGASAEEHFQQVTPINCIYFQGRMSLIQRYLSANKIQPAASEIYQLRQAGVPDRFYPEFLYLEYGFYQVQNQSGPAREKLVQLYVNFPASATAGRMELHPEISPDQELIRAGKLLEAGKAALAREELKELKQNFKKPDQTIYPQMLGLLARASFLSRNYQAVLDLETEAKKYGRNNDDFLFYLAWSYHRLDQDLPARAYYEKFIDRFPQSVYAPRALYQLARLEQGQGNFLIAALHFEKLAKIYPECEFAEEANFQTGLIYFRQEKYDRAAKTFNQALPTSKNPDQFLYWLAKSCEKNQELEKAKQYQRQLTENFPASVYAYLLEPAPKPIAKIPAIQPSFSAELPKEFEAGLMLARFGLLDPAQEELHYQLKQKSYPFTTILELANRLIELQAYPLLTRLYYSYLSPKLSPEQKVFYYSYLYPRAFSELIEPTAQKYNIDPELAYALVRSESNFDPSAISSAGAIGLSQVMPFLADSAIRKMDLEKVDRSRYHNPELNLEIGLYHLNELQTRYQYSAPDPWPVFLILCAYNAGTQPVDQWFNQASQWAMPADLWMETIAYPETKNYLKRVLGAVHIYRQLDSGN